MFAVADLLAIDVVKLMTSLISRTSVVNGKSRRVYSVSRILSMVNHDEINQSDDCCQWYATISLVSRTSVVNGKSRVCRLFTAVIIS